MYSCRFPFLFGHSPLHLHIMAAQRKNSHAQANHPRVHKVTFMLNDEEQKAVDRYLARYKIQNKSRWYRETIFSHILRTLDEDYPTLFKETEMRR
jgi:predicted Rossmann fold nucleotide-binding protein DprA/Smf involved in DNA uptake